MLLYCTEGPHRTELVYIYAAIVFLDGVGWTRDMISLPIYPFIFRQTMTGYFCGKSAIFSRKNLAHYHPSLCHK